MRAKLARGVLPLEQLSDRVKEALDYSRGSARAAQTYYNDVIAPMYNNIGEDIRDDVSVALASMRGIELMGRGLDKTGIDIADLQGALDKTLAQPGVREAVDNIQGAYRELT